VTLPVLLTAAIVVVAVYAAAVLALVVAGHRQHAEALARFVPDCAILFTRLAKDPRVRRRYKLMLAGVVVYLAMPIDLIPDFIPVAGQLDDAIVVSLALRAVLRGTREGGILAEHWPGPESSLAVVERLAGAGLGLGSRVGGPDEYKG
jgi:uncharacterized membrane protein YkvA (DUF1232 family)